MLSRLNRLRIKLVNATGCVIGYAVDTLINLEPLTDTENRCMIGACIVIWASVFVINSLP